MRIMKIKKGAEAPWLHWCLWFLLTFRRLERFQQLHLLLCFGQQVFPHHGIECSVVNHHIKGQAESKAHQVDVILVQAEQVEMQAIDDGITHQTGGIIHFQIDRRHQHGEVVKRFLFPAVIALADNHCKHEQGWNGNENATHNRMVFEVNRQSHQDEQDDIDHLWDNFTDFESFHY